MNEISVRISGWVVDVFKLPSDAEVGVAERDGGDGSPGKLTEISIPFRDDSPVTYPIHKEMGNITEDDIRKLQKEIEADIIARHPVRGRITRFLFMWFGLAAFYSTFAVCPFCGQAGCVVGIGSATLIGGSLAAIVSWGKSIFRFAGRMLFGWMK